jgi:hypothetical protein
MKRILVSIVVLSLVVAYATPKVAGQSAVPAALPVPLASLAGHYVGSANLQFGLCFNPKYTATEPCSTKGAVTAQLNAVVLAQGVSDTKGNGCGSFSGTETFLSGSTSPIVFGGITVSTTLDYNPATGVGDSSFTNYSAGSCIGSVYSTSKGAVVTGTGTLHFVVSSGGNRIDNIATSETNPQHNIGSFAGSGFSLRQ